MNKTDIIPIQEAYPSPTENYDYTPLLYSMGYDILGREDEANYNGTSLVFFKDRNPEDGKVYGLLVFSWGECADVDDLQHAETYEELEWLRDQFYEETKWFPDWESMSKYIKEFDWDEEYGLASYAKDNVFEWLDKSEKERDEVNEPEILTMPPLVPVEEIEAEIEKNFPDIRPLGEGDKRDDILVHTDFLKGKTVITLPNGKMYWGWFSQVQSCYWYLSGKSPWERFKSESCEAKLESE